MCLRTKSLSGHCAWASRGFASPSQNLRHDGADFHPNDPKVHRRFLLLKAKGADASPGTTDRGTSHDLLSALHRDFHVKLVVRSDGDPQQ